MKTIFALSTPIGSSAIAVIRISGSEVNQLISEHFRVPFRPRVMTRGLFYDHGQILDDVLACFFPGPHSFTGEDMLEINCHGNMLIVKKIFQALQKNSNVIPAQGGDFIRRSFENGKIDLIQAEAIGQIIHATNDLALENAQNLLKGKLSSKLNAIAEQIKMLSALFELEVDFVEEELEIDYSAWIQRVDGILIELGSLVNSWQRHSKSLLTPRVVLCGKPNAGKSSLINALTQEDRLLVSHHAGTTRDWVEVPLYLEKGQIILIDTAGLGEAIDDLDALSQAKTREMIQQGHLVLWIADGTEVEHLPEFKFDQIIRTKVDHQNFISGTGIFVSSKKGDGLQALKDYLSQSLFENSGQDELWMGTERQLYGIEQSIANFQEIRQGLLIQSHIEILAFEIREARNHLQEVIGLIRDDEILGKIFSSFCIGK